VGGSESILTFALGFLIASLIGLILAAPLWRRAEKITRKRLLSSLPISVEDVAAEKDKLRADFALSTRKLEINLEKLRKKAQGQMTSVQEGHNKLIELETELKVETETKTYNQTEIASLAEKLAESEADLKRRTAQMDDMKAKLSDLQSVLNRQAGAIKDAASLAEGHRDEIETLKDEGDEKSEEITKQASALTSRDAKLAECGERVAAQKLLVAQKTVELKEKAATIASLQSKIADMEAVQDDKTKANQAQITALDAKNAVLVSATEEVATLKTQLNAMADEYKSRVAADNHENALLRQRIGDLATDVQRMTDELDRGDRILHETTNISPDNLRLKGGANGGAKVTLAGILPVNAAKSNTSGAAFGPVAADIAMAQEASSLADRIRSLQRGLVK